ncbi:MAG: B12-binding domain-containing radical SAM protein [Desulfobacterales bacterium]
MGTLASALKNRVFLQRYAHCLGKKELTFNSPQNYPEFDIRVLNLSLRPAGLSIVMYLTKFLANSNETPLIIGMTATSAQLDEASTVALAASRISPTAIRIIGGAHVSVAPVDFLQHSQFQVACIGEGVETMAEIVLQLTIGMNSDFAPIAGIAFKDENQRVNVNPPRVPILDLDDYPLPSDSLELFWDGAGDGRDHRDYLIYILSGYGCPHDCIFCGQRSIHGPGIRERSAGNIFEEISKLVARGFCDFAFVQETFLNGKQRIEDFCRKILESGLKIKWTAEARADQLTHDQLIQMKAAGLRFIQIGVESGDPCLLKSMGKNINIEQVVQMRNWCYELKIDTAFYLLVGLPGQGWQSVLRTALFIRDYPPYNRITQHASVSIAIPYPGTKIQKTRSVRLTGTGQPQMNWPSRNPDIRVNDTGEFLGKNYTETDDMTADEILEAWLYLDDFCHFLLYALNAEKNTKNSGRVSKSMEYAGRMFHMIQRRTIRDIIIRAHSPFSAKKRKAAYAEIVKLDENVEKHLKDVTIDMEPLLDVLSRFLANANFLNGYDTMKMLSIRNRIKWMKMCSLIWHSTGREISDFKFVIDNKQTGQKLNFCLQHLNEIHLNRYLAQADSGDSLDAVPDLSIPNPDISALGIRFRKAKNLTMKISVGGKMSQARPKI